MDRSALFTGDMNRALTGYDVSQSTLAAAEKAVTDKKTQVVLRRAMNLLGTPIAGEALVLEVLIAVA